MWTVVYIAQSRDVATKLQDVLQKEGLLVKSRPISRNAESEDNYFEVLVPEAEVSEAHSIIIEKGY